MKVKTFTQPLQVFQTLNELEELDRQVNQFLAGGPAKTIISVNDTTTNNEGGTIGIIRVLAYKE